MPAVTLPEGFLESEKGNNLLVNEDGGLTAWVGVEGDTRLEIEHLPGNSPAFYVSTVHITDEELAARFKADFAGWTIVRTTLAGFTNGETIYGEDEHEEGDEDEHEEGDEDEHEEGDEDEHEEGDEDEHEEGDEENTESYRE